MNKLSKEELIEIVKKLCNGEGDDEECSEWIDILIKNTKCPEISNYIFWSKEELTPEQIIEKALSYRPILL